MKPNQIIRISIIALLAITIAGISSCKKEEDKVLRTKTYSMNTHDNSGITGTVEFKEKSDGSTTILIKMSGTANGAAYPAHIHSGPITSPGSPVIDFATITASGTAAEKSQDVATDYDDMLQFDGCFVAHNPSDISKYVLVGNIGKNAM